MYKNSQKRNIESYIYRRQTSAGYDAVDPEAENTKTKFENAGKAQLNVAEYEGVFLALLLFFFSQKSEGLPVTIVCVILPLAQFVYFWGRALSGSVMPWAPLGALPRYIAMGIMIYILYNIVAQETGFGPGKSAVAVLGVCLSAKFYMSFCIRSTGAEGEKAENASKAQLNAAEYDGVFLALLLFFFSQRSQGLPVTIVCVVLPLAQFVYFWGRALSGSVMPWAPLGALPRYIAMGIMIYILYKIVAPA